jgi:hypothetical protein
MFNEAGCLVDAEWGIIMGDSLSEAIDMGDFPPRMHNPTVLVSSYAPTGAGV